MSFLVMEVVLRIPLRRCLRLRLGLYRLRLRPQGTKEQSKSRTHDWSGGGWGDDEIM